RRRRAAARRARARRLARLLPAIPVRRRLGHARRAGAEVLAGLVPRRGARGPDRQAVRAARLGRARRRAGDLHGAPPRAMGGGRRRARELPGLMARGDLLKMSELAERSGVSAGTIKHYLREGLLGRGDDVVRTSRNMAYYPPDYVDRIRTIKRLQEERFMPLRAIKDALERAAAGRE